MENILYKDQARPTLYFERNLKDYYAFCKSLKEKTSLIEDRCQPVFLCIGTDRMTGDCLGPLVGYKLSKHFADRNCILGTLEHPVHALNLDYALTKIRLHFSDPFVIVIDASLGLPGRIGNVTLSSGALLPGEGMKKKLPPVGDLSITGIVNSCYGDASLLLQNTRLHLVNELADYIVAGLINSFPC